MEVISKIKKEMDSFQEKRKALVEELRKDFPELLKPLFEEHPAVESVTWRQYTPYFNDGGECIFGVHNDYDSIDINEENYYDMDEEKPELEKVFKQFGEALSSVPEDFYKDLFGDHAEVKVKADGTIDVEEYDHD